MVRRLGKPGALRPIRDDRPVSDDGGSIAFDLDMTLVDSRPASIRALERLASEPGANLDIEALMSVYGLPLPLWLPGEVDAELFRTLQREDASLAVAMPGAAAAFEAVRRAGARVVVVTAAPLQIAAAMLKALGLVCDRLRADVWAGAKVEPLREERCRAFVGDHEEDMLAAKQAGAIAVGVRTGTTRPFGADVELGDLTEFPGWLEER